MNVTLASGGYPWTVIRAEDRDRYLAALDRASIDMDISPFCEFIAKRVQWSLERRTRGADPEELRFRKPDERYNSDRGVVEFTGQDGATEVRCGISREAFDDHFHGDGKNKLEVFRRNRATIESEARRKYLAGRSERDGSVLIRTEDLER